MLPPDLRKLLAIILHSVQLQGAQQNDALRRNLTDQEYADWFLSEKIQNGSVNPAYAINDFVVFRVAFEWPRTVDRVETRLRDEIRHIERPLEA